MYNEKSCFIVLSYSIIWESICVLPDKTLNSGYDLMQPALKTALLATAASSLVIAGFYLNKKQKNPVTLYNSKLDSYGLIDVTKYTPKNSIIVFDMHKVLFGQNFYTIVKKVVSRHPHLYYYVFSPWFLYKLLTLTQQAKDASKGVTIETMFDEIGKAYPEHFSNLKQDLIHAMNEEPLYADTITIAQQLKKMGYEIFLLSNIMPETWNNLKQIHPVFDTLFDGVFIPTKEHGFIRKPDPRFYQKFREYLAHKNLRDKTIVFIDDRQKNIIAAGSDVTGIVFTDASQLREQLKKLGITLLTIADRGVTIS